MSHRSRTRKALFVRPAEERAVEEERGFFSEGTGDEQKFGRQLLEHVAKRWPSTKDGKAAKNKLKLATQPVAPIVASV